jgi:hypothetical protein
MVHFNDDEEEEEKQSKLEESILNLSTINSRISYMDKLEGLNRDFQTKVKKKKLKYIYKRDLLQKY